MSKIKTMTVSWGWPDLNDVAVKHYHVEKITDSVKYHPGQQLTKREVDDLCESKTWKVTVIGKK